MRQLRPFNCAVILSLALVVVATVLARPPKRAALASAPGLEIAVVSPEIEDNGAVSAPSSREVTVVWEVRNTGGSAVTDLRGDVGATCQCKINEQLPPSLAPGKTARLIARLRAPQAGTVSREVRVFGGAESSPLVSSTIRIQARVTAPSWLIPPTMTVVKGVAGYPLTHDLIWEAIENAAEDPWVESIHAEPENSVSAALDSDERPWGEDGKFVLRRYRVTLEMPEYAFGTSAVAIHVVYRSQTTAAVDRVAVQLELIPALAVIPSNVELRAGKPTARVVVVRRDSVEDEPTPQFDAKLLHVASKRRSARGPMVYEISAIAVPSKPTGTEVLFHADGLEPARLNVRISSTLPEVRP